MNSKTTQRFWARFDELPASARAQAERAFAAWMENPWARGLAFKQVHPTLPIWSARVGLHWRVLGKRENDLVTWFWIGSHAEYDRLLSRL